MTRARLVVFAREPALGRVKTRLAAGIGEAEALAFYRQTLETILDRLSAGREWRLIVAVSPDAAAADPLFRRKEAVTVGQGDGDLGARLARFLDEARSEAPVFVVGSDVPDLDVAHVRSAAAALEGHDLVLGPAPDGGYWLIGASRPPPADLFRGVRWSTADALADTLANARDLKVALAGWLADVDDEASYRAAKARP